MLLLSPALALLKEIRCETKDTQPSSFATNDLRKFVETYQRLFDEHTVLIITIFLISI